MNIRLLFAVGILLCPALHAQELTADEAKRLEQMNTGYAQDSKQVSFEYAWLLYRTDDTANFSKADTVLSQVIDLQDHDPESLTYGQWDWHWQEGEKKADLNSALFKSDILFAKLWDQQSKMAGEAKKSFLASCKEVVEAAKRRWDTEIFDIGRDFTCYSNIFVLYVETFTLAGERFNDARLKRMAKSQWARWYNHVSFFGIDEFASPTYNYVVFSHLMNIHNFCHDERIERETKEILDFIYLLQSAITHPALKLPVSGISRDYRNFLLQADARSDVLTSPIAGYAPPQRALEINEKRAYPFEVIGRAAVMPFIFKSYQLQDAAMGSMTGGNCFQQQIHCLAAVGGNENERAVLFVQGSNTPVNGFTDQKGLSTLCVYNRLPSYWHFTQWRGDMAHYRETFGEFGVGISPQWQTKSSAPQHLVLAAYGYEAHIFPFAVEEGKLTDCALVLKHRTTTSLRYHPRPREFDEYVFPERPDWFGAYITLVKAGSEVSNPGVTYANDNGVISFKTSQGRQLRLYVAEKGDTKQLFNVDPALIPRFKIID